MKSAGSTVPVRGDAEDLLARLGKPVFDPIRTRPEFIGAEDKIRGLLQ